ncbi:MAG: response regulator [Candidatus Sabulitectum sp.]|nr:response regulator [Candidatus Sabulitectum sp.]
MTNNNSTSVLVVEDDHLVCEMVIGILGELGYDIVGEAADGHNAVEMVRLLKPDVVVMDIKMPRMTGIEAAILIQRHFPTPVVILSAYETQDLTKRTSEAGVGAYVVKPPKANDLMRAIEISIARFADMSRLRKQNKELQEALETVKQLTRLLPICTNCKKIKGNDGCWHVLETYLQDRSETTFTHGLCPECIEGENQ